MEQEEKKKRKRQTNVYIRDLPPQYVRMFNMLVACAYDENEQRVTEEAKRKFFMEVVPKLYDEKLSYAYGSHESLLKKHEDLDLDLD